MENYTKKRLAFAKQNINLEWGRVIFCSETQINGIGIMGLMTEYGLGKMYFTDQTICFLIFRISGNFWFSSVGRIPRMVAQSNQLRRFKLTTNQP